MENAVRAILAENSTMRTLKYTIRDTVLRDDMEAKPLELTIYLAFVILIIGILCVAVWTKDPMRPPTSIHRPRTKNILFKLPPELRNMIYEHTILQEREEGEEHLFLFFDRDESISQVHRPDPAFLYASARIHSEALPMFLALTPIELCVRLDCLTDVRAWLDKIDSRFPRAGIDLCVDPCCWRELRRHGMKLAVLIYDFGHVIEERWSRNRLEFIERKVLRCMEIGQAARRRRGNSAMKWLRKKVREELGEDVE